MQRGVSILLVVGTAIAAVTWACVSSPSFSGSKLTGPATITVGGRGTFKMTATRTTGPAEDDTSRATWDVSPASVARVDGPGVVTGLSEGLATLTATVENTVSTLPLRVLTPGDYHVSGTVRDASGQPISGASVATTGPPFAQTATGADGGYTLSNLYGVTTLRASVVSFTTDRQVNVNDNLKGVDLTVPIPTGFVNVTGTWTTTLAAPSSCAPELPAAAQQRSFAVSITQSISTLNFTFTSPTLGFTPTFVGTLNASGLTLPLLTDFYYYYYYGPFFSTLTDRFAPGQWIEVKGQIQIPSLTSTTLDGTLTGEFDYFTGDAGLQQPPASAKPVVRCAGSTNVTFTRTGATAAIRSRR